MSAGNDRLPARLVPLLYWGTAHASLTLACLFVAWWPRAAAGFFYHSWMAAIVHLVTLGWITFSILGAIYIVGPLVLRMPMPARRGDCVSYALTVIGLIGMVTHFWIEEFDGLAWSAAAVTSGILYVAARLVAGLRRTPIPAAVKLHLAFASVNVGLAASMGIVLGFDKVYHFLPGFVLSNVFAHAHLAAIGWATMMVVGVGYRLLPMTLPSKMPGGPTLFVSAALLEAGVLGLSVSLLFESAWRQLFGMLIVAGLASFAAHVVWMVRTPRRKPAGAPTIDFAVLHAGGAGASLVFASAIGVALLFAPPADWTPRAALAYGVFALLGFLSQMVVAMETRLVPLFAWFWAFARSGGEIPPTPPLSMREPRLQAAVFIAWTIGVPAIAAGLFLDAALVLAAGAWTLLAGMLALLIDNIFVFARAFKTSPRATTAGFPPLRGRGSP